MKSKKNNKVKNQAKDKKTENFWLKHHKIKPCEVQLERFNIQKKTSEMWVCLECFVSIKGNHDVVAEKSASHICVKKSDKQDNINALKKMFKEEISNRKSATGISGSLTMPLTSISRTSSSATIPPPPPPPIFSLYDSSTEKPKLTWGELKALQPKKYASVECSVQPRPVKKQILKNAPSMSVDGKGFISTYDQMQDELKNVLMRRGKIE